MLFWDKKPKNHLILSGRRDLNSDCLIPNQVCYRYTTPRYLLQRQKIYYHKKSSIDILLWMSKKFTRTIENFVCENCGKNVIGNGYTNHCFYCLWSKHVDVNPGDREEDCGGMMKPIGAIKRGKDFYILHQCAKCGFERNQKMSPEDNFGVLVEIQKKFAEKNNY